MTQIKIGIIGAGLTGLVAAKELSKKNIAVTVYEKLDCPGGRMRTENIEGWNLDVGFQVLLTAYPFLQKHLDLSRLNLQHLEAAATVFQNKKTTAVGDPFRTKNILWPTIFSNIGYAKDKWLIYKLKKYTERYTIDEIFELKNETTKDFLEAFGFSDRIIQRFFRPFFGGIFLEENLDTSARMFLFVFKMFALGNAAIPKAGIGEVAHHLIREIPNAIFKYGAEVTSIKEQTIILKDGTSKTFDYVINTIPNYGRRENKKVWQDCFCLYFEHQTPRLISTARIGLNANPNRLINNLFYPSSFQQPKSKKGKELLSITVLDAKGLPEQELIEKVKSELAKDFQITNARLIHLYPIPYALPKLKTPKNSISYDKKTKTFEVGDFLLNGSQNAACKLGETIATHLQSVENIN